MLEFSPFHERIMVALHDESHVFDWRRFFITEHVRQGAPKITEFAKMFGINSSLISRLMDASKPPQGMARCTRSSLAIAIIKMDQEGRLDDALLGYLNLSRDEQPKVQRPKTRKTIASRENKLKPKSQATGGLSPQAIRGRKRMKIKDRPNRPYCRMLQECFKYSKFSTDELAVLLGVTVNGLYARLYGRVIIRDKEFIRNLKELHAITKIPASV